MEWLNAISLGRQHRAQDQATQDQRRLGELTGQVFTATPEGRGSVLSEIARIDPGSAMQMRSGFMREDQDAEEAKRGRLVNMAKMLAAAPEPMRGGLYSQMVPGLRQMGLQAPDTWSPDLMGVVQSLAGAGQQGRGPMTLAPGSVVFDPVTNREIYRNEPQAKSQPIVRVPDGQGGEIAGYNTPNGFVPLGGAPAAPALPYKVDLRGLQPESVAAARQQIEADIGRPLNDSEWAQVTGQGGRPAFGRSPPPSRPQFRTLTPDEVRAQGLPDGTFAQINEQTGQIDSRLPDAGTLKEQREIRAKAPRLNAVVRSLSNIQTALGELERGASTFGLTDTGRLDQFVAGFTPEGNKLNQAASELQANLMALTRVPGVGSQSDLETRLDALRYPSLENGPAANQQSIEALGAFVRDLADAYEVAGDEQTAAQIRAIRPKLDELTGGAPAAQPAPAASPGGFRVISRRPAQ